MARCIVVPAAMLARAAEPAVVGIGPRHEEVYRDPPPSSYDDEVWRQEAGPTVFAPFGGEAAGSPHLGTGGWGLNFRVRDLDAMVGQLQRAGVDVEVDPEVYPTGASPS